MSIKYTLPKTIKSLSTMIDEVITSYASARVKAQVVAVAILMHAIKHGDNLIPHVNRLCDGLDGAKADLLVRWFETFGGYTRPKNQEFTGWKGRDFMIAQLDAAKKTMWWEIKGKQSAFKDYSFAADLQRIVANYRKKLREVRIAEANGQEHDNLDMHLSNSILQEILNLGVFDEELRIVRESDIVETDDVSLAKAA